MNLRVITEPGVYMLGKQVVQSAELSRFLADHGVSWSSDTEVPAEVLTETAGRVCFDDQTEVMTDAGWMRFAHLDRTEQVLTLNPTSHHVEFQRPTAYQVFEYDGPLVCADGRDVSFAVTPDHRMYGSFGPPTGYDFIRAGDIGDRRFCLPSAGRGWVGRTPAAVRVPAVQVRQRISNQFGSDYGVAVATRPAKRVAGRDRVLALAKLCVYYATEGSVRDQKGSGRGIVVYGDHVRAVTALCRELALPHQIYTDKRNGVPRVIIGGGVTWMRFFGGQCGVGSPNKRLPRWVLDLPAADLSDVWDILVRTDGHIYESGREVLVTSSPTLAGNAQEILAKIGASSAVRPMTGGTNYPMLMASRKQGRTIHLNDSVPVTERAYRGRVYCVSVPNGIVYVRRDGKVHFSGNCYMSFQKPRPGGNAAYLDHIKEVGHGSVLEHGVWNFLFTGVSRSLTHELVRHRAGWAYSQLSQRYVDESVAEYVEPDVIAADPDLHAVWHDAVSHAHAAYMKLAELLTEKMAADPALDRTGRRKAARQAARSVLPNATETKIFVTANARALRHFLEQRGAAAAEPEIRKLANRLLDVLAADSPHLFGDYTRTPLADGTFEVKTPYPKV